jgi:hypothetical protein
MRIRSIPRRATYAAVLALSLAGCGGGGGGGDPLVSSAPSASSKNSFYVSIPRFTYTQMDIAESSPSGGQKTTLGAVGTTKFEGTTYDSRSIKVAGTPGNISESGPLLCATCNGGSASEKVYVGVTITKDGKTYTIDDDVSGLSGPAALNEHFLITRNSAGPYGNLQSAQYGSFLTVSQHVSITSAGFRTTSDPYGSIGHFHSGTSTGSDDMASLKSSSATATYNGTFYGYTAVNGDDLTQGQGDVAGRVSLTADFGAAKVSGNVYDMQSPAGPDPGYGIALNGTITGAHYSGTAQFTNAASAPGAAPVAGYASGEMTGGFYGPGALETAGAVQIVGNMPTDGGAQPGFFGGSYGAVKAPAP